MTQFGSMMAGFMFVLAIFKKWFPQELCYLVENYFRRLGSYFYPYITILFPEYQSDEFERSKAYIAIDRYLSTNSSNKAKRLKANVIRNYKTVILGLADYEEVTYDFQGIKIWCSSGKNSNKQQAQFSIYSFPLTVRTTSSDTTSSLATGKTEKSSRKCICTMSWMKEWGLS